MKMYRVNFDSMVVDPSLSDAKFHRDFLDNCGHGYTYEEAVQVQHDLSVNTFAINKNFEIVEVIPNPWGVSEEVR